MKKTCILIITLLSICISMASAYALHYTGINNQLPANTDKYIVGETKATANRYIAINTREGYPNPGQLIGPTYLKWDVTLDPHYVVIDATIGKADRDSHYIYDDRLSIGADYFPSMLQIRNLASAYLNADASFTRFFRG